MIIEYPHIKLRFTKTNNIRKDSKYNIVSITVKCEKCEKIFTENNKIFEHRISLIGHEYCGKCSKPLMCSINGLKGSYDINGELKNNTGRFTSEKWENLSEEEYIKRKNHNKQIAIDYNKYLNDNPDKKTEHYEKIFKHSKIGYVSIAQKEIFEIVKNYGYDLECQISNLKVDFLNEEKKIVIEYYGDYWHCNPYFWKDSDYNKSIKMFAKDKWNADRNRSFYLRNLGYDIFIIWENSWKTDRNSVFTKLNSLLNNEHVFDKWIPKDSKPLKGRTYVEIYGKEKAEQLKKQSSESRKNRKCRKKYIYVIITPYQGNYYVSHINLKQWRKNKNSYSKKIIYNRVIPDINCVYWDNVIFDIII